MLWACLMTRGGTPVHLIVMYPFNKTVGCSCGWITTNADPDVMEDLFDMHLDDVRGWGGIK